MKPQQVPLPVRVNVRAAAIRYAEEHRLNVNLDMLGGIVDAAVAAVMPMIQAEERRMNTMACPFDSLDHSGFGEDDLCPVCGDRGTQPGNESGSMSRCVSSYR